MRSARGVAETTVEGRTAILPVTVGGISSSDPHNKHYYLVIIIMCPLPLLSYPHSPCTVTPTGGESPNDGAIGEGTLL